MSKIKILPDLLANKIAAGEVVERPASVVKELLENSVDAKAKSVQVIVREAGRNLIQIVDDGVGMTETDARMSFERHATSKIQALDDLSNGGGAIRSYANDVDPDGLLGVLGGLARWEGALRI